MLRGGPFAVLLVMLACSRLAAGSGRPLGLVIDIGLAAGVAGLVALGASLAGVPPALLVTLAACGGCGAALLLIIERFARHQTMTGRSCPASPAPGPLQAILAAHPLLSSAIPLSAADLSDLPAAAVADLARRRVVAIGAATGDDEASGAARELLKRHAATHLLRRSQPPPNFLAICGGAAERGAADHRARPGRAATGAVAMTLELREGDAAAFFNAPFNAYPQELGYVSPMRGDIMRMLDPKRNPLWLAGNPLPPFGLPTVPTGR